MPTAERVKPVPVEPSDQVIEPVAQLAVKVNVLGKQTDKVAGAVTVGGVGLALMARSVTDELASEVQPFKVQVAETA